MVIIVMMSYPPESSKEIGKRFLALGPMPDHISRRGPYVSSTIGGGIQTINIFECEKSRLAEAIEIVNNRYATYFGVPGLTYSIQVWLDAMEALKAIGMA